MQSLLEGQGGQLSRKLNELEGKKQEVNELEGNEQEENEL